MDSSEALDEQSNLREIYEDISMNIQETRPLQQPAKAADPTDQLQELEADDDAKDNSSPNGAGCHGK